MIVIYTYLSLLAFYALYLAVMSLYRAYKAGTMPLASKVLGYQILFAGLVFDVGMNLTLFSVFFLELPQEWLVTDRLKRHINKSGFRGWMARFLCHDILSPFDIDGNHCD